MGRGNVCVTGAYEGLYYIDWDHFRVYELDDDGNETDTIDYDAQELSMRESLFGEFRRLFVERFPSFYLVDKWLSGCHSTKTDTPFWRTGCSSSAWLTTNGRWRLS